MEEEDLYRIIRNNSLSKIENLYKNCDHYPIFQNEQIMQNALYMSSYMKRNQINSFLHKIRDHFINQQIEKNNYKIPSSLSTTPWSTLTMTPTNSLLNSPISNQDINDIEEIEEIEEKKEKKENKKEELEIDYLLSGTLLVIIISLFVIYN